MRITVMGVMIVIGGVLLLAFVVQCWNRARRNGEKAMTNQDLKPNEWLTAARGCPIPQGQGAHAVALGPPGQGESLCTLGHEAPCLALSAQ